VYKRQGAVNSIEALKDKIKVLAEYATQLTNGEIPQVEISFEDHHPEHPFNILPLFALLEPPQMGVPPVPDPDKPIGYQKVFPNGMPLAGEYHALVPTTISLKLIDFLMKTMKEELAIFESQIDGSINPNPDIVMPAAPIEKEAIMPKEGAEIIYTIVPKKPDK